MQRNYTDRKVRTDSYGEGHSSIKDENTFSVISQKMYKEKYPQVQVLSSMAVQTVKTDEVGKPVQAKTPRDG